MVLHANAVQAHVETYIGLVEAGVGVVPAWGGCKELLSRYAADSSRPRGPMPPIAAAFETIGLAKVARSAAEAMELGFLRRDDGITFNRERLLAEPHKGMRYMFTMMNAARLAVGIQGLGLAETAYQSAVTYAKERLQGRSISGVKSPDKAADPIIVHPDIRRKLLTMRACNEACRALALWTGIALDVATKHTDPAKRREADDLVALLTPIIKAFFTDHGFDATNAAMQIFGGHGYIRETGIEQLVRDARITQIYEGTNAIQALDLVGRKMPQHAGRLLRRFFHPISQFVEANLENPDLQDIVLPLAKAFARLQQSTIWIAQEGLKDPEQAGAAAGEYLRFFALVALGYMWALMAKVALERMGNGNDAFYEAKLATARFYMQCVLPQTASLATSIAAGAAPVMGLREEWF